MAAATWLLGRCTFGRGLTFMVGAKSLAVSTTGLVPFARFRGCALSAGAAPNVHAAMAVVATSVGMLAIVARGQVRHNDLAWRPERGQRFVLTLRGKSGRARSAEEFGLVPRAQMRVFIIGGAAARGTLVHPIVHERGGQRCRARSRILCLRREVPSGGPHDHGVATSIAAFVGRARRGPFDEPVFLTSYGDYERVFGGLWVDSTMSYAVRDFFRNGGAPEAIVVRVHNGATSAVVSVDANLELTAADPGAWGNNLRRAHRP